MNYEYLTTAEIAEMLDVSRDTVRRIFRNEPGVLNIVGLRKNGAREYRILRIPRSVFHQFIERRASTSVVVATMEKLK